MEEFEREEYFAARMDMQPIDWTVELFVWSV